MEDNKKVLDEEKLDDVSGGVVYLTNNASPSVRTALQKVKIDGESIISLLRIVSARANDIQTIIKYFEENIWPRIKNDFDDQAGAYNELVAFITQTFEK